MVIGVCAITLHLPACQSLKDKRQILKSLIARVHNQYTVAIAEVDYQDLWQSALLGISCVSNSEAHADEILKRVLHFIEETHFDLEVTHVDTDIMRW
jgi:uncharacterized protein YlxP (DUF503 family)